MLRSDLCDFDDAYIVKKANALTKTDGTDYVDIRNKF